jgi:hypothetical protein
MANQWQQTWDFEFTEEALAAEIAEAEAEAASAEDGPRAESVKYNRERNLVEVHLKNGAIFAFPPHLAQGLDTATPEQLDDVWLGGNGQSLHWESLDADFSLPALVQGMFGTRNWMAELGRKGGQKTSTAKRQAARENGKKGGRPKKANSSNP